MITDYTDEEKLEYALDYLTCPEDVRLDQGYSMFCRDDPYDETEYTERQLRRRISAFLLSKLLPLVKS